MKNEIKILKNQRNFTHILNHTARSRGKRKKNFINIFLVNSCKFLQYSITQNN